MISRVQTREKEDTNLQFLVDVVDAELFETIGVEDFEAVDIEDADCVADLTSSSHRCVDTLDYPVEEFIVHCFGEGVADGGCLDDVQRDLVDGTSSTSSLGFNDTSGQCLGSAIVASAKLPFQQKRHRLP
jgi:hypothetical protein